MNGRDLSAGIVVIGVRAGFTAGRLAALPIRALARTPFAAPVVDVASGEVSRKGAVALAAFELEPMLDRALATPLPDAVAKKLVDHLLASPELDRVVEHVAASSAVRAAVARQSASLGGDVATQLRARAARLDDSAEARVRSFLGRPVRDHATPYGGIASRALGFSIDLVLLATSFLILAALVGLAATLLGHLGRWPTVALLGAGWVLTAAAYFIVFWSTAGQTPGLRVMDQRVACPNGEPPGAGRAAVRFLVLTLGLLPLLAGGLVVLLDDRRRALHDVVAGTVVVRSAIEAR